MAKPGLVTRFIAEMQYDRGIVYLDRCGSLTLKLQSIVGDTFRASVPGMSGGQLESAIEQIAVKFSPTSLRVEQLGPTSGARVEKITTDAWDVVADTLEVRDSVKRFAVRIFTIWTTPDLAMARAALRASKIADDSDSWRTLLGASDWSGFIGCTRTKRGGHVRRAIDTMEFQVDGLMPERLALFFPPACVQYDADFCYDDTRKTFGLKRDQVRDFIRSSWNSFQQENQLVGENLSISHPELLRN